MKVKAQRSFSEQSKYIVKRSIQTGDDIYKCCMDRPCLIINAYGIDVCPRCNMHSPIDDNPIIIEVSCNGEEPEYVPEENEGEHMYQCPWCGKEYVNPWDLVTLQKNKDSTDIECDECGKTFWVELKVSYSYVSKVLNQYERGTSP